MTYIKTLCRAAGAGDCGEGGGVPAGAGGGPGAGPEAGRGLEHPRAAAGDGHKIQPEVARIQVGFLF